jgi:hypothetical protein
MNDARPHRIDVALVHYPVVNRDGKIIGSAVTNLDLHDIARAGRTYGVEACWIVTPYADQRELAGQIVRHWTDGYGGTVNPDRREALSLVKICADLEEVIAGTTAKWGKQAAGTGHLRSAAGKDRKLCSGPGHATPKDEPLLLLFGTAWGLAPEAVAAADAVLPPIRGRSDFNHLSVRSAVAIILDRLLGE